MAKIYKLFIFRQGQWQCFVESMDSKNEYLVSQAKQARSLGYRLKLTTRFSPLT